VNDLNIRKKLEVSERDKYDPLNSKQTFPAIHIRLHCCHYWLIMQWECSNLASPFWRLYYNTSGEASIMYDGVITALNGTQVLLIPPNTAFSTRLTGEYENSSQEIHVRKKITNITVLKELKNSQASDHLFIHFNLGLPYDLLEPGIYKFQVKEREKQLLDQIRKYCIAGNDTFNFTTCAAINGLILFMLDQIPPNYWEIPKMDKRVADALTLIEQGLDKRLTNNMFADNANMTANSFARIFKESTGFSIHQYIKKKRVDKAVILLHHTNVSIEIISQECGFSDRHHLSRVFKEIRGTTPSLYKRHVGFIC